MELLILIVVLASILLSILFILYQTGIGKYKRKNDISIIKQESIEKFKSEYPEKDIDYLKIEIEKISDMLLDNEPSNRYTERLQERAKKDSKLDILRNAIADDVEIIKYDKGKLKAQVNYIFEKEEHIIVMYMNVVRKGRAFLTNYKTLKRTLSKNT